jgi:hypothetical protein
MSYALQVETMLEPELTQVHPSASSSWVIIRHFYLASRAGLLAFLSPNGMPSVAPSRIARSGRLQRSC